MIPYRMLSAKTVERELGALGCERKERFRSSGVWETPWGFRFFVPEVGPAKMCPEDEFRAVLADIIASKPLEN